MLHFPIGVLLAGLTVVGCGGGSHAGARSTDPAVRQARATLERAPPPLSAYRGPRRGPPAQPRALVVFIAADLTDGGIAAVASGVQQAVEAIGWRLQILNGQATVQGQSQALAVALRERPGGIVLGGVDAASHEVALRKARALGIPVVGWQSAPEPGPDPALKLFDNVASDPAQVARLAAAYAIATSNGAAGVVIFTDNESAIDDYTSGLIASDILRCRRCAVLETFDTPPAPATTTVVYVEQVLEHFGARARYLLALNSAYVDAAQTALIGAGRRGDQPPFSIAAGEGDASEFARIRDDAYQKASIAEPLNLQGWQLIDELNRARAGQPPSGYVAPPRLITRADVPSTGIFDPPSGYRNNYLRIWRR